MPDDSAPAVHGAVAAVLAVMPVDPDDGTTFVAMTHDPAISDYHFSVWGDPEPLAAKYAAAVLQWLASTWSDEGQYSADDLRAIADQIDPPIMETGTDKGATR